MTKGNAEDQLTWRQVKMGVVLEIKKDEEFPADMLLLYAEDHELNPLDMIYVDTVNFDGESNLKQWNVIDSALNSKEKFNSVNSRLVYDQPNLDLENWQGIYTCNGKEIVGDITNLMLWGCTLRNTHRAYGVVIYVGKQTKIVMNSKTV